MSNLYIEYHVTYQDAKWKYVICIGTALQAVYKVKPITDKFEFGRPSIHPNQTWLICSLGHKIYTQKIW